MKTRVERLQEFIARLADADLCTSFDEARDLVAVTLTAVEDDLSSIPYDPTMPRSDGRMYPPLDDSMRAVQGLGGVFRFRNARHNTYIGNNGAIRIDEVNGQCLLNKPGQDSLTIEIGEKAAAPRPSKP